MKISLPLVAIALGFSLLAGEQARAFKPTENYGHWGITNTALSRIAVTSSDGDELRFTPAAIEEVQTANAGVDGLLASDGGEFFSSDAHCDDELMVECSARIERIFRSIVSHLTAARPNGAAARRELGRALHTLQDFYSHSNWVNLPGGSGINPTIGTRAFSSNPPAGDKMCEYFDDGEYDDHGLTDVTTGYFSIPPVLGMLQEVIVPIRTTIPWGKCDHGLVPGATWNGETILYGSGINKDSPTQEFHAEANAVATDATEAFVARILDADGVQGNDDAVKAFLGIRDGQMIGFVIDTTGSMQPIINGVKASVNEIVQAAVADPERDVNEFLLVYFGDPSVSVPYVTADSAELLTQVSALQAGVPEGGGDCPEVSMAGLRAAVSSASQGAQLYLFTDASATDTALEPNVLAEAAAKDVRVSFFISGSCSPIDEAYVRIAAATGGQLIEHEPTEEATASVFNALNDTSTNALQTILAVEQGLGDEPMVLSFPVDDTLENLTVAVNQGTLGTIRLIQPDGVELLGTEEDVALAELVRGRIYNLASPMAGEWMVSIEGLVGDPFSVTVRGTSDVQLGRVSFVELRGRPMHEGLFEIIGQPLLGEEQTLRARFTGEVESLDFELRSPEGEIETELELEEPDGMGEGYFEGTAMLPEAPFRVYAVGTTEGGMPFQRVHSAITHGQRFRLSPLPGSLDMVQGLPFTARFLIENHGPQDTFSINASDSLNAFAGATPMQVELGEDESAEIEVLLQIPATAATGTIVTMSVVATSFTDGTGENSTVASRIVGGDSDGDGVSDAMEQGRSREDDTFDGNGDDTPDFMQPEVVSTFTASLNAYLTFVAPDSARFDALTPIAMPSDVELPAEQQFPLGAFELSLSALLADEPAVIEVLIHDRAPIVLDGVYALDATPSWLTLPDAFDTEPSFEPEAFSFEVADGATGDLGLPDDGLLQATIAPSAYVAPEGSIITRFTGDVQDAAVPDEEPDDDDDHEADEDEPSDRDAGDSDAGDDDGGKSSCSCRAVGAPAASDHAALAWLSAFGLLAGLRLSRRRAQARRS